MTPANHGMVEPRHPLLQRLFCYWQERRGARVFPARRDLDPLDFSYALGHVSLIDVAYEPLRFRFRLVPSTIAHYLGYEATGRNVDALPEPELRACLIASYTRVVSERRPLFSMAERILDGRRWRYEVAYLPLANDGATIDMLMVCRIAEPPRRTSASTVPRVDSVFVRS
jgi:hypothetical protein